MVKKQVESLLVNIAEVAIMTDLGETKIKEYEKSGHNGFPKRVDLGGKRVWRRADIEKFVQNLPEASDKE